MISKEKHSWQTLSCWIWLVVSYFLVVVGERFINGLLLSYPMIKEKNLDDLIKELEDYDKEGLKKAVEENTIYLCDAKAENSGYEIRIFDGNDSEVLNDYLGLAKEITFRDAGGGTGENRDIDEYDLGKDSMKPFKQLVIVKKDTREIIGGYRFAYGEDLLDKDGKVISPTAKLFNMSNRFKKKFLPYSIELGRSWVLPEYQKHGGRGILAALMKGLAGLMIESGKRYYFGKITRYPLKDEKQEDFVSAHLNAFLDTYYKGNSGLIKPRRSKIVKIPKIKGMKYDKLGMGKAFKALRKKIENKNLPPILSTYLGFSISLRHFGTAKNEDFGNVHETAIILDTRRLFDDVIDWQVKSYLSDLKSMHKKSQNGIEKIEQYYRRFSVNKDIKTKKDYIKKQIVKEVDYFFDKRKRDVQYVAKLMR